MAERDSLQTNPTIQALEILKKIGANSSVLTEFSRQEVAGLIGYLQQCSDVSLDNLELRFLSEKGEARRQFVKLIDYAVRHLNEAGHIQICQGMAGEFIERAASSRAKEILVQWARKYRKHVQLENKTDGLMLRLESRRTAAVENVVQAQNEAEGMGSSSYGEQHTSQLYYERHGCISCHRIDGPHQACGFCKNCYSMIRHRRRSIIEGRKVSRRRPPARLGVPSVLGGKTNEPTPAMMEVDG